ncbi:MAG: tetratricopeptide repeat protein, partial [Chitinophagales bacterium]|nr:tetratricopeptide repeat protein [Chitinophagales bacterium]
MAKVISISDKIKPKIKFEKARKGKKPIVSDESQLGLFNDDIKVVDILAIKRPFEIALSLEDSEPDKAIEYYTKAVEAGNFPADAFCNMGILYYNRNESERAIDCFKEALKVNPSHFEAHFNIANLYFDMGNYEPAKVHYEIASGLQPDFPNTYYNLGLLLAMDNDIP